MRKKLSLGSAGLSFGRITATNLSPAVRANLNQFEPKIMKPNFSIIPIIILTIMTGCKSDQSEYDKMGEFGQKYTDAWNSKVPEKMASFYAEDGTLIVNNGTPAVGRKQLAETAQSYMEAFPDLALTMDSLTKENGTYRYYWTFKGTNTGPNGTENKVDFSGFEEWTMNDQGLVQKSIGTYNAEEYQRQLEGK
jgi:nuclear transport factor 2 (NTF2) superfamily protein